MVVRWSLLVAVLAVATRCGGEPERTEHASTVEPGTGAGPSTARPDAGNLDAAAAGAAGDSEVTAELPLGACAGAPGRTLRTLIVGNSQIYFFDMPKLLSDLSRSGPPACPRIEAEGFTRGGQNLQRLWVGGDSIGRNLATTLRDGRYDVVVIAESIDLVDLPQPKTQFVTYANIIIDAARASGARPVLYATPYVDQKGHRGFVEMAEPQLALGMARDVTVAAGGLAWLRVWSELPSVFLHHPDHSHPGYKGSMISAMVIYAAITRATPIGLTDAPPIDCYRGSCPSSPPITAQEADVFQRAAWDEARATALVTSP